MSEAWSIVLVSAIPVLCLGLLVMVLRRRGRTPSKNVGIKGSGTQGAKSSGLTWKVFKIFLGSPGGLDEERKAFCEEVDRYNKTEANPRNINFFVVKWEDIPSAYGRPQSIINGYLVECHCYILILWERWGSPPGNRNGKCYESGSEEEYKLAEKCFKQRQVINRFALYFKAVDERKKERPDEQLSKVLKFRRRIKEEHTLLYNDFKSMDEFRILVRSYLAKWVLEETGWIKPEGINSVFDYEEMR